MGNVGIKLTKQFAGKYLLESINITKGIELDRSNPLSFSKNRENLERNLFSNKQYTRRIDHWSRETCLEASRIFDAAAIPTASPGFFEAAIKVFNGTSGDDLRLGTGLRSLLTTPRRRQRDGEAANCTPISLTRILSYL